MSPLLTVSFLQDYEVNQLMLHTDCACHKKIHLNTWWTAYISALISLFFTISILGKNSAYDILKYFPYFPKKRGFSFSMKCQSLFSRKNKYIYKQFVVYWIAQRDVKVYLGLHITKTCLATVAQLDAPSDWRPGGRGFNPRRGRQHPFVEIDHEIFSTVILSLPLIQEGQLSVSGERMCTILVSRSED